MEKRAVLAFGISILIFVGWGYFFAPPPPDPPLPAAAQDLAREAAQEAAGLNPDSRDEQTQDSRYQDDEAGRTEDSAADLATDPAIEAAAEETVSIETDLFEVTLSNRGGHAVSYRMKTYRDVAGDPLELLPTYKDADQQTLGIDLEDRNLAKQLQNALFEVSRQSVSDGEKIRFRWSDGRGLEAVREFVFRQDSYLVDVRQEVKDRGRPLDTYIVVGPGFAAQDYRKGRSRYYFDGQGVWLEEGSANRVNHKKMAKGGQFSGPTPWAGLEDQFFAALVLSGEEQTTLSYASTELVAIHDVDAADAEGSGVVSEEQEPRLEPVMSVSISERGGQIYVGPKDYRLLKRLGSNLEEAVWFSTYPSLAFIVKKIFLGLIWLYNNAVANWGMAIILATVILRVILFPLNQFAMVRMKKSQLQMQELQPKLNAIKNRYRKKKDAQSRAEMNQETMALYKAEGVNPAGGLAGCLPLLLQFPILIGFYNMLTVAVELRGAPFFGWIQDLTVSDPLFITPVLMGVTMFAQQKLAMTKVKDPAQLQQQKIMMFMPFMFTFMCLWMPAGLVLYWFTNNLLGIGQQWLVNKQTRRIEAAHHAGNGKGKKSDKSNKGKSGKPAKADKKS